MLQRFLLLGLTVNFLSIKLHCNAYTRANPKWGGDDICMVTGRRLFLCIVVFFYLACRFSLPSNQKCCAKGHRCVSHLTDAMSGCCMLLHCPSGKNGLSQWRCLNSQIEKYFWPEIWVFQNIVGIMLSSCLTDLGHQI